MKTKLTPGTEIRDRRKPDGFTLLELMVALAVLGIIYQMLPAVQRLRESANRQAAEADLRAISAQIVAKGALPASLHEVVSGSDTKNGFRLSAVELTSQRLRLVSEPVPGVTGAQTGFLEITVGPAGLSSRIQFSPTPGADEMRKRMMSQISSAVANQFGRLAGWAMQDFHFRALEGVRAEIDSPLRQQDVFKSVAGPDGRVSFASLDMWSRTDSGFRPIFESMWHDVAAALQLGAQGEIVAGLPGLTSLPAVQNTEKMLNFAVLSDLTNQYVLDSNLRSKLLKSVSAAERTGDPYARKSALDQYTADLASVETKAFAWGIAAGGVNNAFVPSMRIRMLESLAEAMK